jgi:valyl-tRNA synthetase
VQAKLSNERFVNNAPEQVVIIEKKKEADALSKIETLKASIENLK